jgi:hypothetical protein
MNKQTEEFSILARELLEFVNDRPFDVAFVEYEIFEGGSRIIRGIQKDSVITQNGPSPNRELRKLADRTARVLVETVSEQSGEKAWGLMFKLWPDGKFKVEYSYIKPAWLEESENDEPDMHTDNSLYGPKLEEERDALNWLQDATARQSDAWGLGRESSWNINAQSGEIFWNFDDNNSKSATIQFLGTLKKDEGEFRWAWANSSIPDSLKKSAWTLRRWGEEHSLPEFSEEVVVVDELRVWSWAAMAARMSGAQGAYRVEDKGLWIYLVFDNLK